MRQTENINVRVIEPLVAPADLKIELPMTDAAAETVVESRETVKRILAGEDSRLIVVVGPCSIHDEQAGLEYASRLAEVARRVQDRLFVLMRVYFEKPHHRRLEGIDQRPTPGRHVRHHLWFANRAADFIAHRRNELAGRH